MVLSLIVNAAVLLWCVPAIHGLNFGVDFAGGTEMEVKFAQPIDPGAIRHSVEEPRLQGRLRPDLRRG